MEPENTKDKMQKKLGRGSRQDSVSSPLAQKKKPKILGQFREHHHQTNEIRL